MILAASQTDITVSDLIITIPVVVVLFGAYGTLVGMWWRLSMRVKRTEDKIDTLDREHSVCNTIQQDRWDKTNENITAIKELCAALNAKQDAVITELRKNGGKK